MASPNTLYRRAAAKADMARTVRPFFTQPAGYRNRHVRRCRGRCDMCREHAIASLRAHLREQRQPTRSDAATEIESEAPT